MGARERHLRVSQEVPEAQGPQSGRYKVLCMSWGLMKFKMVPVP